MSEVIIASIWMFIWELYGNIVGGWSLVTQAVLQNILWIDIKSAIALDNTAVIWANIWMIIALWKTNKIQKWFWVFILFQIVWATIWTYLLLIIPESVLKTVFILAIIWVVIKNLLLKEWEHKEEWFKRDKKSYILLGICALIIWAYNAAFVIWDWIIALLLLTSIIWIKYQNAIYLLVVSMLFSQPVAAVWYYNAWLVDLSFAIPMAIWALLSWVIAWKFLEKLCPNKLKTFLKYLSIFLVIYLVYGLI